VRDDLLIVAWQPSYFRGKTTRVYLILFYYALFGNWGLALLFLNDQNK
jgi:hypothetical protein